jgi:hypothetical protein
MQHMQRLQPSKGKVGFTIHYLQLFPAHLNHITVSPPFPKAMSIIAK